MNRLTNYTDKGYYQSQPTPERQARNPAQNPQTNRIINETRHQGADDKAKDCEYNQHSSKDDFSRPGNFPGGYRSCPYTSSSKNRTIWDQHGEQQCAQGKQGENNVSEGQERCTQ